MRGPPVALVALVLALGAVPAGAPAVDLPPPGSLGDVVRADLVGIYGSLPSMVFLNGAEVPVERALRVLDGVGLSTGRGAATTPDTGVGNRAGSNCNVAAWASASISGVGPPQEALEGEVLMGAPGGAYCSGTIPWLRGSASATVAYGADAYACLRNSNPSIGARWATGAALCGHDDDFTTAAVFGNVAKIDVEVPGWISYHSETLVSGIPGANPTNADVGVIAIA